MKKRLIGTILCVVAICLSAFGEDRNAGPGQSAFPAMYNVVWDSQSENASGSMPVGGGDIGCNVWVEDNQLFIYFQRSGIHDEFNGFPKLGRVRIWLEPSVFDGASSFRQELKLKESSIEISASHKDHGDVCIKLWVEVHRPVAHVETRSSKELTQHVQYESWRTEPRHLDPKSSLGERWGWWDIEGWPHEVVLEPDRFVRRNEGLFFYHVNPPEKLSSKLAYEDMGLGEYYGQFFDPLKDLVWGGWIGGDDWTFDGKHEGSYQSTPHASWRYRSETPSETHHLSIVLHTSRCGSGDKWLEEIEKERISGTAGKDQAWEKNQQWWARFWERSRLIVNSDDGQLADPAWQAGRNYNLFRYMTACNAYGENPTMFNGGLFTFDPKLVQGHSAPYHPDWRRWGGGNYTLQNQRWVYWPMLRWGDREHMTMQFDFFMRVLDVAELRVRHHYGHDGCLFAEPASVYGLPTPMLYGYESSYIPRRQRMGWQDPGMSASVAIMNHHTAALEFSHMILEYFRYTGEDIRPWLPFVKSTLDFYDRHYRMRALKYAAKEYDEDGKLVLFPTSVCENFYFTTNAVPDVAGLRSVVGGVLKLPQKWIEQHFGGHATVLTLYNTLPELHYETVDGDVVLPPARSIAYPNHKTNNELYLNYPMFPFNLIKLGDEEMAYVHNTYKHWSRWQDSEPWEVFVSWTYANVAYARMGMTDKARDLTLKKLADGDYRFPAFWGPGYDWTPDHNWGGTGAVGLQEMLVQTVDDSIVLLPAWPKDWDAEFKFHAPGNTIVEGKVRNGEIEDLNVKPRSRMQNVVVFGE